MKNIKSQSATEFLIIIVFMIILITTVILFLNQRISDINRENYYNSLVDVSYILESEIQFALKSENGYKRVFRLPEKLLNLDYQVTLKNATDLGTNYSIFIFNYTNSEIYSSDYFFFTTKNITGSLNLNGENETITKIDNMIYLNKEH